MNITFILPSSLTTISSINSSINNLFSSFIFSSFFEYKLEIIHKIIKTILELCNKYNYTPNKLAELSAIAPSTLRALLANNVDNPSSTIIFKIRKTLKIELKDFYDSPLFDMEKLEY